MPRPFIDRKGSDAAGEFVGMLRMGCRSGRRGGNILCERPLCRSAKLPMRAFSAHSARFGEFASSIRILYNRSVGWAAKGVWVDLVHTLAQAGDPPAQVLLDSSAVKVHRFTVGGPQGSGPKPLVSRGPRHQDSRPHRPAVCDKPTTAMSFAGSST